MNILYKFKIIFSIIFIMLLSSCASDGGSSGDKKPKANNTDSNVTIKDTVPVVVKGILVDGYIKGATICVDSNEDGKCTTGEVQATTNDKGEFSLSIDTKKGQSYALVGSGGIDTATNKQFISTYKAIVIPVHSSSRATYSVNMTPLSTLVSNIYSQKIKTNSSYQFSRAVSLVANSMSLSNDKLLSDPLKDKTVFEKTQIIVQTVAIISASIREDETNAKTREAFDFVMNALSASISEGKHRRKLDVSQLVSTLKQSRFNNKTVNISSSVESVANKNIANISKQVSLLSGDTIDVSTLVAIQKNTQVIVSQTTPSTTPQNQSGSSSGDEDNKTAPTVTAPIVTTPTVITTLTVPVLTVTPKFTKEDSIQIEVKGKAGTLLVINDIVSGTLSGGVITITLDTSGLDGDKNFKLKLKDGDTNSSVLDLKITKDTVPPAKDSTINDLVTTDTTPALSGNMPSGSSNKFIIKIKINSVTYLATNNGNNTWSIADNKITELDIGSHSVTIIVTDEAGNTSSFLIEDKIKIDNSGFLIDSAVEGVKYISGQYSGYTDKDGLFKYDPDAGVTFYIGDEATGISMGKATQKTDPNNDKRKVITLFDLAGSTSENDKKVLNMGKFLQSLDSDGDSSNGITIDAKTKESIALLGLKNRINFDMDIEAFHNHNDIYDLFNDLADHFGEHRGLIDTGDAKAHLVEIRDGVEIGKSVSSKRIRTIKQEIKILDGIFLSTSGVVEGLEYRSGNQFGRTDVDGKFKYEDGKKVKFYIYQLELGITEAKPIITPADLVVSTSFNHPKPRNIIRLLNAFDKPSSPNILIDDAVREALEKYRSQIDINLPDGKANEKLGIAKGDDEFGAQFEDFEIGKDILDEIDTIRGGS